MAEIKELTVVCMDCKRVKKPGTDSKVQKNWKKRASVIIPESETSHGICPRCMKERMKEFDELADDLGWLEM